MYRLIGADGREYGPVSPEQLRQWIREGRANAETRVRPEDAAEWKPLSALPEFAASFAGAPSPIRSAPAALPPLTDAARPPKVESYLIPAIAATLCCCLPFGVVAIVYSAQVGSKLASGDHAGAAAAAQKARMWTWVAFGAGVALTVIYLIIGAASSFRYQ